KQESGLSTANKLREQGYWVLAYPEKSRHSINTQYTSFFTKEDNTLAQQDRSWPFTHTAELEQLLRDLQGVNSFRRITLALAKGPTAGGALPLLKSAGIHFPDFCGKSRKLVLYDTEERIKLIFVKAVDIPTYVETGAADIGVAGKYNILASQADLYELIDLGLGK